MQQLHPFRPYFGSQRGYAGKVAAWAREAGDKSRRDRVISSSEYDWNSCARRLCREQRRRSVRGNYARIPRMTADFGNARRDSDIAISSLSWIGGCGDGEPSG